MTETREEFLIQMGKKMRTARRMRDIKQHVLAKHIGVTPAAYSYYENGKRAIDIYSLKKIAELMNCSIRSFLP